MKVGARHSLECLALIHLSEFFLILPLDFGKIGCVRKLDRDMELVRFGCSHLEDRRDVFQEFMWIESYGV